MLLEKYEPKKTGEVLGNYGQIKAIKDWIAKWKKGQALLAYGPTGCGKSISIRLAAKEMGLDIVESHASDYRGKAGFDELLTAARHSMSGRKKIILVEDVELIELRKSIYNLIGSSLCPVVLVAEGAQAGLMRSCTTVKFTRLQDSTLLDFLKKISLMENIKLDASQLTSIAKSSNGDVRAALIDLEFMSGTRERSVNIFELVRAVFKNEKNAREILEDYTAFDTLMMWIDENIAEELKANEEIASAYDYLSRADVMRARIAKRQSWNLQKYILELILRGIAASRKSRPHVFVSYKSPWFTKNINDSTMEKIGRAMHIPKKQAASYLPIMSTLVGDENFCSSIGFDDGDIEFVKKANK